MYEPQNAVQGASYDGESQRLEGFMLNGQCSLDSLAQFYGLRVAAGGPQVSIADYLARTSYGTPRVGHRAVLDRRVELIVRAMERDVITRVCLRILPRRLPERRRPRTQQQDPRSPMRRWSDRLADHHVAAAH